MYKYGWIPLLSIGSYHNIVNQLYSNTKLKKIKKEYQIAFTWIKQKCLFIVLSKENSPTLNQSLNPLKPGSLSCCLLYGLGLCYYMWDHIRHCDSSFLFGGRSTNFEGDVSVCSQPLDPENFTNVSGTCIFWGSVSYRTHTSYQDLLYVNHLLLIWPWK